MSDSTAPENTAPTEPATKPDWTPPASQDALNRIIADRLSRERAKYADYDDLKERAATVDALQTELDAMKAAKRRDGWLRKASEQTGVPMDALRGETEKELLAHAEQLQALMATKQGGPVPRVDRTPEVKTTPELRAVRDLFGPK